ncbi:alpha/beta fold hydrolase [Acinetobacter indicus]|uniref:alpha/beta fold hydrolase n=1 Tax=Acinetobacter indicus TaxID=756892 RepID=UPI0034D4F775
MHAHTQWIHTSDQQRLYVKSWGKPDNPALVLVHGYPDNQEVWEAVIAQLIQDFYIVTYDVRGAGQSSIPKHIRDYRLARLSEDLLTVVDAVLPNRPFHLAAHDWGSIQSWESVTDARFRQRILSYSSISGPCLDHAAFWMRAQLQQGKAKFLKQLGKSWYIAVFQLPLLAPTVWQYMSAERWGKMLQQLEQRPGLALNPNIQQDGQYGVNLYRANFIPRLLKPRQRVAICPVQAVVLTEDRFVSPELIDEVPNWAADFQRVEIAANHWVILSQPERIAQHLRDFAFSKSGS